MNGWNNPSSYAALPVGASINPRALQASEYFSDSWVAYVLFKTSEARTRPTRVYTSHGNLGLKVGDEIQLHHDQTGANLGTYRVSGIARADNGAIVGDVPSISIKHCVAK